MTFYAKNGDEITLEQCGQLVGDMSYKRVLMTTFPSGRWVSTVWLGIDHGWHPPGSSNPILIFETMIFGGPQEWEGEDQWRYSTEEEAKEGHERVVNMVRELEAVEAPEEVKERGE